MPDSVHGDMDVRSWLMMFLLSVPSSVSSVRTDGRDAFHITRS